MDVQAKRYIEDLNNLTQKQANVIKQLNQFIQENERKALPLVPTVRK